MSIEPISAKSLFLQAMELPTAAERAAFLDRACGGQAALKARVEGLIRTAEEADSLLDNPATQIGSDVSGRSSVSLDFLKPCNTPNSLGCLGGYVVLDVIGRGGMGIVLRAMDSKLNRIVAIKVLVPEFAGSPQARKRFAREAQAAAAVSHDHIVTIHAVDDEGQVPYIVMECVVGQSLQQKIDKCGALGLKEILRIGMQMAAGLAAAHKQGLVHRDIKPANILLENGIERVKITDFGLARATDDVGMTQSGQIAGTPQYMSPEQAMGQQVDTRSDLFSLGSVLYTLCTGRPGFRADSTLAVMKRVCDDVPRPIGETNPEIPEWLIEIIDRLLMKKPEDRIQTAAEVAELLNQHLAHLQQPASVPRPGRLRSPVVKGSANRLATAVLVATALMMLMGVAYSVWTDHLWFGSPVNPARLVETIPAPAVDLEPRAGAPHIASPFEKKTVSEPVAIEDPLQMPTVFPFAKGKARAYQEGWAKRLNVPVERSNSLNMTFRLIPPGQFQMGSMPDELNTLKLELEERGASAFDQFVVMSSLPLHTVELSQPFYMSAYEVTVAQFQQFVQETSYVTTGEQATNARFTWKSFVPEVDLTKQPVVGVSWEDADEFCKWLSRKSSPDETPQQYSLPTEAQWEYACRAGTDSLWSCADNLLHEYAIIEQQGQPYPAQIGLRRPNPFGLFDMHGNVDEWCLDWHNVQYYARSPLVDPAFVERPNDRGSGRVARGGAWNASAWWSRSSTRTYDAPLNPIFAKGFRVVCKLPALPQMQEAHGH
jgi:serine/threonine protein kinase/formylglycine-generating enzyme required for sulfatase activity